MNGKRKIIGKFPNREDVNFYEQMSRLLLLLLNYFASLPETSRIMEEHSIRNAKFKIMLILPGN